MQLITLIHKPLFHLLLVLLLIICAASSEEFPPSELPSSISLRAAVLHAPPFALVTRNDNGTVEYSGFQYDLLQRLKIFASQDNVDLNFELSEAPNQYEDALNLVASDCQGPGCDDQLDMIVGNFYATPDRALRVDLSPSWLKSTISTIKYKDKQGRDFTTLTQASDNNGTVCLKDGTFYAGVVREKFPHIQFHVCDSYDTCIEALKAEKCALYSDDELQLHYRAAWDTSLEVTPERFNTQWIVWPKRFGLDRTVSMLLDRWLYAATINATLDELYFQYFQKALCPVGTAGANCQLPCDPDHGQADATGACVCKSIKWTGDDCSVEVPEEINAIPTSLKTLSYVLLGINVTLITICALWLHGCRFSPQVRYCQPFFLLLVLLGCLISSCTIIPMAQEDGGNDDKSPTSCMAIPWLYSVGFSVTFGTLFAKILRVYLIFTQAAHQKTSDDVATSTRRYFVTFQETLCVIGVVLLIDVAILVAWTVVDPLTWHREVIRADQFGAPLESEGYCTSDSWLAFGGAIATLHLLLMGVACYMCYAARHIPTKFSEGKYLSIAMASNLQIFLLGVPILIIIGTEPQASFFVRSVIILMNDFVVVSLVFGNLMYSVHMAPPENNRASFVKREISSAVVMFTNRKNSSTGSLRKLSSSMSLENPQPGPPMDDPSASASEQPDNFCPTCSCNNRKNNSQLPETDPPRLPLEKRPAHSISSLTLGSRTSSSQSRKSVSWGRAYFSECAADEEEGIPIVDTLPVDASSPPEEQNRTRRFSSPRCQGAPQYTRPTASPESSEEFQVSSLGPVMPRRKSSIRVESTTERLDDSFGSHGFIPQPRIDEESPDSSDSTNEMDPTTSSEQFVSALGFSAADHHGQPLPFESSQHSDDPAPRLSRNTVESMEGAPLKPDRRPTDTTFSSATADLRDVVSAPMKPDRRPTDTSTDLRDRRPSDTSLSSSGPDLQDWSSPVKPDRKESEADVSMSSLGDDLHASMSSVGADLREIWAPQKPSRTISNTSISSEVSGVQEVFGTREQTPSNEQEQAPRNGKEPSPPFNVGGILVAKAKQAVETAKGALRPQSGTLLGGSRHTVETAQGAPQPPGRRNSSSFLDLDNSSSSDEEGQREDTGSLGDIKSQDETEGTPDLTPSLYSSDEITNERDASDQLQAGGVENGASNSSDVLAFKA